MKLIATSLALAAAAALAGCNTNDAQVASYNLSKAADSFEINRRIVFYNGITGDYMLVVEGLCSLGRGTETDSVTVTCKTGPDEYKKHFLGLSDNVTYFAEQVGGNKASPYQYRVIFKPLSLVPSVDIQK